MPTGTAKQFLYCIDYSVLSQQTKSKKSSSIALVLWLKWRKHSLKSNLYLSSRKNPCINPDVIGQKKRVDSECRKRTAEWVRRGGLETCLFYENSQQTPKETTANLPDDVNSLDDLRKYGALAQQCPYFTAREIIKKANIAVYNYLYLMIQMWHLCYQKIILKKLLLYLIKHITQMMLALKHILFDQDVQMKMRLMIYKLDLQKNIRNQYQIWRKNQKVQQLKWLFQDRQERLDISLILRIESQINQVQLI